MKDERARTEEVSNTEIILIADPRVLKIPILENSENLVDLRDQSEILVGPSPEIENNTCYTFVRKSVLERLQHAQEILPNHLGLCLYEGLRTVSLQEHLYKTRWSLIRGLHPSWSDQQIYEEVIRMVSPVITWEGATNTPPHSTGAAVDVYLVNKSTREPIDMGILAKDWMLDGDGSLSKTHSQKISLEAKGNRDLLSSVMVQAGFVNYPTEYWHWSFGDRYWALMSEKVHALYGGVDKI